jgi:hypothetical protein
VSTSSGVRYAYSVGPSIKRSWRERSNWQSTLI